MKEYDNQSIGRDMRMALVVSTASFFMSYLTFLIVLIGGCA